MITSIGRYTGTVTEEGRLVTGHLTEEGDIWNEPLSSLVLSGFVYVPIEAGGTVFHGSDNPGNILVSLESGGTLFNRNAFSGSATVSLSAGGNISSPNPLSGIASISLAGGGAIHSPNTMQGKLLVSLSAGGYAHVPNSLHGNALVSIAGGGTSTSPAVLAGAVLVAIEGYGGLISPQQAGGVDPSHQAGGVAPLPDVKPEGVTWVLNTLTGGHSTYSNYIFNSFLRLGDSYYGCSANGIFRLDGETDNGIRLDWSVKTGISTFGTYSRKYVHDARLTMRADGDIAIREIVDEQTDRSQAIAYSDERYGIHARRIKLPKGITGTAWQFEVYGENVNADIKQLDIAPLVSQRTQ